MIDTIAWKTWNDGEYSVRESKMHIEDIDWEDCDRVAGTSRGRTLCGVRIPENGGVSGGVEVGAGGDYGDGECKRCRKISEKIGGAA